MHEAGSSAETPRCSSPYAIRMHEGFQVLYLTMRGDRRLLVIFPAEKKPEKLSKRCRDAFEAVTSVTGCLQNGGLGPAQPIPSGLATEKGLFFSAGFEVDVEFFGKQTLAPAKTMENQWVMTVSPKIFLKILCHMSQESTKKQLGPCGNTGKPVVIVKVNKVSFIKISSLFTTNGEFAKFFRWLLGVGGSLELDSSN